MARETVMASPPTITIGTGTTAITNSYLTAWNAANAPFRYETCYEMYPRDTYYAAAATPTQTPAAKDGSATPYRVTFDIDAAAFEIRVKKVTYSEFRIYVNEKLATSSVTAIPGGGADCLILVDFSAVGGKALRRIVIEFDSTYFPDGGSIYYAEFGGIRCLHTDSLYPPMIPAGPTFGIVGDSYAAGKGATCPSDGYASKLGRILGWPNTAVMATGGTGFVKDSVPDGLGITHLHYEARVADLSIAMPNVLLVQGSMNDARVSPFVAGVTGAAVTSFIAAVRAIVPNAILFFTGIVRPSTLTANETTVAAEISAAVAAAIAAGDTKLHYIDPNTVPWSSGTGYAGHLTGDGNADFYLSSDQDHPTTAGHAALATRLAHSIATTLNLSESSYTYDSPSVPLAGGTMTGELVAPDVKVTGLTGSVLPSRFVGCTATGAPTTGAHLVGDWVTTQDGHIFICTAAATPGTWVDAGAYGTGGGGNVATDAIFTAKGGLPVGTGSSTAAQLAVGANDLVLTAASGEATGMKWAATTGSLRSAQRFTTLGILAESCPFPPRAKYPLGAGYLMLVPVYLLAGDVVANLTVGVATAAVGTAPTLIRLGLYSVSTDGLTYTLRASSGNLKDDARWLTKQWVTAAMTSPYTIPTSGIYYCAWIIVGAFGTTAPQIACDTAFPDAFIGTAFPGSNYVQSVIKTSQTDLTTPLTSIATTNTTYPYFMVS
jgi:lysophospholipase L1-like esterase